MTTLLAPPLPDLLSSIDALAPGQSLTLGLTRDAARALLSTLTAERKGLFEWSPDSDGTTVTVEVTRRDAAPGSPRGVFDALAWDHDRLDALERAAFAARASNDLATAKTLFDRFARGLVRHIGFEEDLLFPALEARMGFTPSAGPTAVMRAEHLEIRAAVAAIQAAIGDPSADPLPLRQRLHDALSPHNEKEEQVLYPMADQVLPGAGADELVRRIQTYEPL